MKICWDNLEKLRLSKSGKYFIHIENNNKYYYFDECPECGESYLGQIKSRYCSRQCSIKNKNILGKKKEDNPFYGKKHSKETKRKIGNEISKSWENGNYDNVIKFRKKTMKGKNNPNWKGGISSDRSIFYRSNEYIDWRNAVFRKDNYTCKHCGKVGGKLHVHHIFERSKYPEYTFEIWNGLTLCEEFHKSIRGKEKEFREIYYDKKSS